MSGECCERSGPVFGRADRVAAAVAGVVAFAVFAATVAPNVGLLDSGEFIVAAQHFGVPHPTGYPLWTFGAWLTTLLPLGNAAWEVNLFSTLTGGLAVAVFAGLGSSLLRWLFGDRGMDGRWAATMSCGIALAGGFSVPVWSQATIAEVYGLHSLIVGCFLASVYVWIREADRWRGFVSAAFFLALGMSNHHLTLSLVPVLFLALALVRNDVRIEVLGYLALVGAGLYWLFGLISGETASLDASVRVLLLTLLAVGARGLAGKRPAVGRLLPQLIAAVFLGLSPYLYMPFASSTNPPMNWAYARTREGFFYSINRSQYRGTLSSQLLNTLGRVVGAAPPEAPDSAPKEAAPESEPTRFEAFARFSVLYWSKLLGSFTPALLVPFVLAFLSLGVLDRRRRAMVLLSYIAFFLSAFLQPFFDRPSDDLNGWLLQMPYHGYSFLTFGLVCTIGAGRLDDLLRKGRLARLVGVRALWPLLPLFPLSVNGSACSQRGHWFGWEYGTDMVGPLPRDAVLFGGTDPGRFVPTYMVFGESVQAPRYKRKPDFDRRDVYVITQNALGDSFYQRYIRDHYGPSRPPARNAFERWLGRDRAYPQRPLDLPDDASIRRIVEEEMKRAREEGRWEERSADGGWIHAAIAREIWLRNKGRHRFFVEESFPMEWTYPHAIPRGLVYEIAPEPLAELPPEAVREDLEFWKARVARYLADPDFLEDVDARRSFCKLRTSIGNLYRYRGMTAEAEQAFAEALALWPASVETLHALTGILTDQGRHEEALERVGAALALDPRNQGLRLLAQAVAARRELAADIAALRQSRESNPDDPEPVIGLLRNYELTRDHEAADALIAEALQRFARDPAVLQEIVNYRVQRLQWGEALAAARVWERAEPSNASVKFALAKFLHATGATEEFFETAAGAVRLGGIAMRERFAREPLFSELRRDPRFRELIGLGWGPAPVPGK